MTEQNTSEPETAPAAEPAEAPRPEVTAEDVAPATEPERPGPEVEPEASAAPSEHEQILTALAALEERVEQYNDRFKAYESQVARYHSEAVKLRDRSLLEDLKPLVNALITIHAKLNALAEEFDPVEEKKRRNGIFALSDEVEMALDELGLESLDVAPGDDFQPRQHVGKNRVDTDDPDKDRTVAEVLKQGFAEHGTTFDQGKAKFAAQVNVYRYKKPAPEAEVSTDEPAVAVEPPAPPEEAPASIPAESEAAPTESESAENSPPT